MYTPAHFKETRPEVLAALMAAHPLGALVMHGEGGLDADNVPFAYDAPTAEAPFGVLRAHVARANPVWRRDGGDALVLFQGPQAYVSPALYQEKAVTGKVVPTWDYVVVHARGTLRAIDDPAWLQAFLQGLTARHEAPRERPWAVTDAPPAYIDTLKRAIVGIEIVLSDLHGKWKMSQNRPAADQIAVAAALPALAPWMAPLE